jgi:hypothetical protein
VIGKTATGAAGQPPTLLEALEFGRSQDAAWPTYQGNSQRTGAK